MRVCRGRWVHMNIMVQQELLQHLPRREQEVRIASLAVELERVLTHVPNRGGGRG